MELKVNGVPIAVNLKSLPADITLNTFIREHVGLSGTKFMCLEGGCGVCVCVVTKKHSVTGVDQTWAVNSCLTLLNICNGWNIKTIEGLGNKFDGYHPIQKQLAESYGSQCGYCSPGMVMNMYGLLKSTKGKVTMSEIENAFGGNICRCTGYRPILDAMKVFAVDSCSQVQCKDIEDLPSSCPKSGEKCNSSCKMQQLVYKNGLTWFWPKNLKDLYGVIKSFGEVQYMLVAGNTAHGVYRRSEDVKHFVDVNDISELRGYEIGQETLKLGANLSLTETMEIFKKAAIIPGFEYCQELYNHFDLIANVPVRNMGTLAGNLMMKHGHPRFPSDIFITFEALGAMITIGNELGTETMSLTDFQKFDMKKKIIVAFDLKKYPKTNFIFKSFKIMPRSQNAHAYINSGILIEFDPTYRKVFSARICFGGINPSFVHAISTESFMIGKDMFSEGVLKEIFEHLCSEICPDQVLLDASLEYRRKLACGIFYKCILSTAPQERVPEIFKSGGSLLKRPISSGQQTFKTNKKTFPVTEPTKKVEALVQCSGEAKYMNDLATQPKQVWCAFVNGTKAGARIIKIDAKEALKIPGVLAFFSWKDIPGKNSFVNTKNPFMEEDEEIFCSGKLIYHGQPVGVIVAESIALANFAASTIKISYGDCAKKVFSTLEDILESNKTERMKDVLVSPIKKLIPPASSVKTSGSLKLGQQYHFPMEPHTTVAVPVEGKLEIYSSTQFMDMTQFVIAKCLNMNMSDVQLKVRRLGGGFGTKITRGNQVACAASIVAVKLNKTARFVQTIESMMGSSGKRYACFSEYEIFSNSKGKILALKNMFYEDAGYLSSENAIEELTVPSLKSCYDIKDVKTDAKILLTDAPSHTWFRGPGTLEGFAMIETFMEHVAFKSELDPADVRLENISTDSKIRNLFEGFLQKSEYRKRKECIRTFNSQNRWRKRGLGMSLIQFHIYHFGPFPATVSIYHGDGSVVISHGGIEMGQGMNTKATQVAAYVLGIPMEMIRIEASDTLNGANADFTAASIGSECVCFAVRKTCEILLDRLLPVRETMENPSWLSLVEEAFNRSVNLIASDQFKIGDLESYFVYGMSLTEVEIDVLTGNNIIKRVDILEDTGESLNPSIDVGQIEGAFVMGLGYYLMEQIIYNRETGELLTNRTWNYKVPGCKDIPIDFRIELIQNGTNPAGFMRSKATGEPAICMAISAVFAIQHALQSAREDSGMERKWISLGAPTTPEHILLNCGTDPSQFKLSQNI